MYWTVWIPAWLCRYRIICLPACLIAFCMLSVYLHLQTWPSVWIWYLALSLILPAWHQYEHALVSSYMYLTICLYMFDCLYYCILIVCMPVCMSAFADLDCMSDFDISPACGANTIIAGPIRSREKTKVPNNRILSQTTCIRWCSTMRRWFWYPYMSY